MSIKGWMDNDNVVPLHNDDSRCQLIYFISVSYLRLPFWEHSFCSFVQCFHTYNLQIFSPNMYIISSLFSLLTVQKFWVSPPAFISTDELKSQMWIPVMFPLTVHFNPQSVLSGCSLPHTSFSICPLIGSKSTEFIPVKALSQVYGKMAMNILSHDF